MVILNKEKEVCKRLWTNKPTVTKEGNKPTVTKGGRQLMKMAKKYDLVIMNKKKEVCKGLWTRVLGQERSILDYVLTNSMRRQ